MNFGNFDLSLYEDTSYADEGDVSTYSLSPYTSGTNSSSSIACATLTNLTEEKTCAYCDSSGMPYQ